MIYELTIRQSFTKLRRIWDSNFAGEEKDQASMNMEERGAFYRRVGAAHDTSKTYLLSRTLLLLFSL
jgi:hypothetical protein